MKVLTFLSLFIGVCSATAWALEPAEVVSDYQPITEYVTQNKLDIRLPTGTAVAVLKGDKLVYEGYFGYRDIQKKVPVDENSVFYIASMTKALYSLLALELEEQGKLQTDWSLQTLFPNIPFKPALQADKVTVTDLLRHTSGIDSWPLIQATAYTGLHDKDSLNRLLAATTVNEQAPLGTFDYTNVGYNVLSHWMDTRYSQDWQSLMQQTLFTPLKMQHSSARISDAVKQNWALVRNYSVKSPNPENPVHLHKTDTSMHAAGGVISTARDLSRFLTAMMNQGRVDGQQVFSEQVIAKALTPLVEHQFFGRKQQYGWGWFFRELFGHKLLEHRGGYAGVSTYMSFMPEEKVALVVLSNQDKWGGDLAYALEDIAYGIALGKPDAEIAQFAVDYQKKVKQRADAFYTEKSQQRPDKVTQLSASFLGEYQHDLLGQLSVSKAPKSGYAIQWGNLSSPLYQGGQPHGLAVEFIPNSLEEVVFLTGTDKQVSLQYRDYRFIRQGQ